MPITLITAEPGIPQILITREFAAPRALLFQTHTEPELLVQWLGPRDLVMTVDYFEVRDGGRWRYVHRDPAGTEYGFHGVFHGTPSPDDGIVQTFEFEGAPGRVSLATVTFAEHGGWTMACQNSVYQSVADRDAMIASDMEWGINDGYARLDALLARLVPGG